MRPQTYFHSIVQRIKQEKIGQRSWKSYFIMQESDCTVRITLRNFHLFFVLPRRKGSKKQKTRYNSFHNFTFNERNKILCEFNIKKIFALVSLQVLHICIMILWTFFSKFCKVFIMNYLFYERLVMEQTLVAISPSCNSNLHALPDYILFCNLCPICCRQNCYSTCKNHNACKDLCDFAEKKEKIWCVQGFYVFSYCFFFTVDYNFHQNFPFCKK